jgi:hypothetical protein
MPLPTPSPFGVDIFEMPVTPQRIVEFLREYRSQPQ